MLVGFRTLIRYRPARNTFSNVFNPVFNQRFDVFQILTLRMGSQALPKRPFCPSCSKPARLCICARFKTPLVDNSIAVTILQHNQERNHPLNSTRIATLGLKNLTVATVSDVHFEAQFHIRLLKPDSVSVSQALGVKNNQKHSEKWDFDQILESQVLQKPGYEEDVKTAHVGSNLSGCVACVNDMEISQSHMKKTNFEQILRHPEKKNTVMITTNGECGSANDLNSLQSCLNCSENVDVERFPASLKSNDLVLRVKHEITANESTSKCGSVQKQFSFELLSSSPTAEKAEETTSDNQTVLADGIHLGIPVFVQMEANPPGIGEEESVITATIAKCGFTCSLTQIRTPQNYLRNPSFEQLLASQAGQDVISNGFIVKKLQRKQLAGSVEFVEYEEFEIVVPPGSALLFPTKKSISLEDVDFEVKHLIVLDGTWGKAKRMYHENPWLKLLPHLKLDPNKISLYSEVRHQPKVGCVSTIESVVCALKAFGDDCEGLDNLLDVFKSMIEDQRRCKDERSSQISPV